ncbi:phosphoenolpyruvate--protein phosphotransferase [Granulibacter bethesdensis]|uniref:Phosphoenolpyruvate-protein phosphotransferase n=1 Tax=Granulibacter bethesdensis (strain ATCC BAA-1260 / CGDNIH1) TaxID=391165 RepID=Q0BUK2_GRABC|nr:putative PEP-binding protein [Granulibacter bethesdensis]ABI61500.1 Phosphoenolpyruvate-protein phosphotransferase [Granulibacter bethesdensis CGDNIH1]APH51296.1 Phosphoenolpyruvate-protein phosphotransferase [Granulibacter bethesdensis]APH63990.1 Phosphoenolpyruvate-protein phosphotransferase [Granulibacter bethesdensis]
MDALGGAGERQLPVPPAARPAPLWAFGAGPDIAPDIAMVMRPPAAPRRLLARLRALMAGDEAPLAELVRLVASELVSEVCSIYALRPGEILELVATEGLYPDAVGRTRLRLGEGIVGIVAASGHLLNLPDAQNHPAFAYRPETGEELYASLLAVPVRRGGRVLGVLAVQNRAVRRYTEDEVEVLETVAMVLAELFAATTQDGAETIFTTTVQRRFVGTRLMGGIAVGPVILHGAGPPPRNLLASDPQAEMERLMAAARRMQSGLDELIEQSLSSVSEAESAEDGVSLDEGALSEGAKAASREVLEAYRLLAADSGWLRRVRDAVGSGLTAEAAVHRVSGEIREKMRKIADPYMRERLADMEDLALRLLAVLDGAEHGPVPPGAILVARRLGPAELLNWHGRGIAGVAIEEGTTGGHAAIIARALGLPALGDLPNLMDAVDEGDTAIVDAEQGLLIFRPEEEMRIAYLRAREASQAKLAHWAELRERPSRSKDGTPFTLMLNMGLTLELDQLDLTGAAGIGLFRTEIAMLAHGRMLDAREQAEIYDRVLTQAGDRPVMFRTLDLGGDKMLAESGVSVEENPAMGWRSLRVGLDRPAVMRRQLRALIQAARGRPLSVMFPMVATLAEFRAARALLQAEIERADSPPATLEVGSMLEVPSLLWQLSDLLAEVDFLSIGTNDLLQFLFAADRGTPALAGRYDFLSPAMLDLLEEVSIAAHNTGCRLSVCGEASSRPLEVLVMAALGISTFSMAASAFPAVKEAVSLCDLPALRRVLMSIRGGEKGASSYREPLVSWCREQGLDI